MTFMQSPLNNWFIPVPVFLFRILQDLPEDIFVAIPGGCCQSYGKYGLVSFLLPHMGQAGASSIMEDRTMNSQLQAGELH